MKRIKTNLQIDSKLNNKDEGLLYLYLNYGYSEVNIKTGKKRYCPLKLSTGYRLKKEYLTNNNISTKYTRKYGNSIKADILEMEESCEECLNEYINKHNKLPHPKLLKQQVLAKQNGTENLNNTDYIVDFIDKLIKRNDTTPNTSKEHLSANTIKEYRNTKIKLEGIEKLFGVRHEFNPSIKTLIWNVYQKSMT